MIVYTDEHLIEFQIDAADWEIVRHFSWSISVGGYPTTNTYSGGHKTWPLYVLLMGKAPKGLLWDHRDRDKLNNQRSNLRLVTKQVSNRNKDCQRNSEIGVRGVHARNSGFEANIRVNGKLLYLGVFKTVEEAAAARKAAEDLYWGDER